MDIELLKRKFGISYLRPYQELMIRYIIDASNGASNGRLLGILPTGGGKSLCFMYPIALLKKRTVLIYPLLSLMNDQAERFERAELPYVLLRGGLDNKERTKRIQRLRMEKDISLITNIETLLAMKEKGEIGILKKSDMVIIDEAHTVVTWGESFREAYIHIKEVLDEIEPKLTLAFTATMDRRIRAGIINYIFSGKVPYIVHASMDRENIFYHSIRSLSKINDVKKILEEDAARPAIIFCRSRDETLRIATELSPSFTITHYHAGLAKEEKIEKEKWFLSSPDGVLASTSAYGMGVDKKNIRTVIHLHLPEDASSFMQESGRGGRDGKRMDSYVLYYKDEKSEIESVFKDKGCIRSALLFMMGEEREEKGCLSCSHCIATDYKAAGEEEIISYLKTHPFITAEGAARALTVPFFLFSPRLRGWKEEEVRRALDTLIAEGRIKRIFSRLILSKGYR